MSKSVVLLAEQLSPATVGALGPDFEVRTTDGSDRSQLLEAIADVDAILIRSATKVDAEAIAAAKQLKIIARAGVGLDNVDIKAATAAGVMVVNAPTSNIISAAELAVGHILSLARNIAPADASTRQGKWERSKFSGIELFEKTIGIIGLGRIGALAAQRLAGFGVKLIAYDPFVTAARAQQLGVTVATLDEVMAQSDFITIHIPKTPDTIGLIGAAQFELAKPTLRIVNCSRGGIIDEDALYDALSTGKIGGAALDVYNSEPPKDSPLLGLSNIEFTPHLGASTAEAQEKAGVAVAKSVKLALEGELVPDAVNVAGGAIDPYVRPGLPLMEKLGQLFSAIVPGAISSIDIEVHGELSEYNVDALKLAALKGLFKQVVSEQVSYVNAPMIAEQRGLATRLLVDANSPEYRNMLTLRAATADGRQFSVSGTLTGPQQAEKIIEVNGFGVEVPLSDHLIVMIYEDRPGIVGVYGQAFGAHDINIVGMQVSSKSDEGKALSVISVDRAVPAQLVAKFGDQIQAEFIKAVDIVE